MASSPRQAAAPILTLYREVLKLHRERLPPPMRDLGDSYAHAEFKNHLRGKTTESQWSQFVREWRNYVAMLRGDEQGLPGNASVSAEITSGVYDSLSADQRKRIELLQEELAHRGKPEDPTAR